MFVINIFTDAMFPWRLCDRYGEGLNSSHFFIKVIVKLYVISDDDRRAAAAELNRGDKLEDDIKDDEFQRCVWRERNDLNGRNKEEMTSLGVGLRRGRNTLKGEIEEVMLEGI